ncbi:ABC-F family ATP-binding cassette domain-containing protein [Compostibacter hankyongensis]|uniref:ABC-F family ATP-binding cassette domain-containing protein n=1 Tax=Compostibacter hankyongensis TaxID=1007089 RepID=A0ABP8FL24_9BACT
MLIALQNITFEFGARAIVEDATWHIMPGERIGLIGLNGTGKSTLLRIISGEYRVSSGSVEKARNLTLGFFNQDLLSFESDDSILQVAMTAFEEALRLEKELEQITRQLEQDENEALLHTYSDKLHAFELLDGYDMHHKTAAMLEGLGFSTADLQRPYREFSGGWRMRVLLAKMMLQKPDLLMLDEPTNHLDLPSIEWLERYLQHYDGTVVIVSHDRYFLDRMVTRIVELYQQQLHHYGGNYTFYQQEKELRQEQQRRAYENQQEYIRQQERFVERFRAKATKAAQAQSALKRLERLDRIEEVDSGPGRIHINFTVDKTPGKMLCTLQDVSKSFGDISVLRQGNAAIYRGDKIALIGANGKGKSTLLRIVAGTEPFEGTRNWGHNVEPSFYAQHQLEALHLENGILDELKSCGSGKTEQELRTLLGCFLFSGDDVFKKIKILSGGEKARVALAKTIISKANFLLLDEPTNHLDINSVEMLIEALGQYSGSYILVSHDRYFVSRTANKIWEISEGEIKEFAGTYDEWEDWKKRMALKAAQPQPAIPVAEAVDSKAPVPVPEEAVASSAPAVAEEIAAPRNAINKTVKKEVQKQQKRFAELEEKLNSLNSRKAALEAALGNPEIYAEKEKFLQLEQEYQDVTTRLAQTNASYEKAFESLMALEAEQQIPKNNAVR